MMTDHCLLHYRIDNEKSSVHDKKKIYCVIDEWNEIYNFVFSKQIQDIPLIEKLAELQHRTYLWNLGRLDHEGKKKFIKEWHLEAKYRRRTKRTHLLKLSLLHFIIEGMILGLLGSIVPVIFTTYGYLAFYKHFDGYLFTQLIQLIEPEPFIYSTAGIVVIIGILVGMVGSASAVRKYLKI